MAFTIPGVIGNPIVANDYTQRIRQSPGLIGWYTAVQRAQLNGPTTLLVPRAGAALLEIVGTSRWAAQGGEQVSNFIEGSVDYWRSPVLTMPGSNQLSIVCAMNPATTFVEPWGLLFSGGARLWLKPAHGANNNGLDYLPAGSGATTAISTGANAIPAGSPGFVTVSIDFNTGTVRYQSNSETIYTVTHAGLTDIAGSATVQAFVGMGRTVQPFVGKIMEWAWFSRPIFNDTATLNLIDEYMATVWSI